MSHDTHQSASTEKNSITALRNSFWLVVILVGLFIAAINFVKAESGGGSEGKAAATTQSESGK